MRLPRLTLACLAAALTVGLGSTAHADTYAPGTESQTFATGLGLWTGTVSSGGLCVPGLTCATLAQGYAGAGGADGNGYLRTAVTGLASTALAASDAAWESPAFTYIGTAGKVPTAVTFDLSLRPALAGLVDIDAPDPSTYRVDLIAQPSGTPLTVVPATRLQPSTAWTAIPTVSLDPATLTMGGRYTLRITTSMRTVVSLGKSGEIGFDDVVLTTTGPATPPGGGGGGTGGGTGGGAGGGTSSGPLSGTELRRLALSAILPTSGTWSRRGVSIRLGCPARSAPQACAVRATGLQQGKTSRPATRTARATVQPGQTEQIRLTVLKRTTYQRARKVWVRATVTVGDVRVTVVKRLALVR